MAATFGRAAPPAPVIRQKQYRYTSPAAEGILSAEQRDFYEANGYLVIDNMFSHEQIDRFNARFKQIVEDPSQRGSGVTVMRDIALARQGIPANDERVCTKIQNWERDEQLMEYCRNETLLRYVSAFTGNRGIYASHTMLINKPIDPGQGTSRHPLHQDQVFFPFEPADKIVCAWTAMQPINRENGCLVVVPGSHRGGDVLDHGYPEWEAGANLGYVGILGLTPDVKITHLQMSKGSTVFFHPLIFHGSGRNTSKNYRKAISCHFVSADCQVVDVKGTIQETEEEGLRKLARPQFKRRTGLPDAEVDDMLASMKMKDFWLLKSVLVYGDGEFAPSPSREALAGKL